MHFQEYIIVFLIKPLTTSNVFAKTYLKSDFKCKSVLVLTDSVVYIHSWLLRLTRLYSIMRYSESHCTATIKPHSGEATTSGK